MKYVKKFLIIFGPLILGFGCSRLLNFDIYSRINKPFLAPPKLIFPIAWTILYVMIGVSYYLLIKDEIVDRKAKAVYYGQLFLNFLWSFIFFGANFFLLSLINILLLDIFVWCMIYLFYKKNKISAYLLIPYFLWILFATYLNLAIWLIN